MPRILDAGKSLHNQGALRMLRWIILLAGFSGVVYYLANFSGVFVTDRPMANIVDVIGKMSLSAIFLSWFFIGRDSRKFSRPINSRLLRKNLLMFTSVVALLLGAYGLVWPQFTTYAYNTPPPFNFSAFFESLPYNDLSWLREHCSEYIAKWLRLAYFVGFSLPIIFPCLKCFLQGRYIQGWHYILSGHLLQLTLAFPFYALISVDEIWVVKHIPDGLARIFPDPLTAASITMNNFPSLHTSVAFASLLVAQREPDKLLRISWTVFCGSVIIATFFFPIHWALDVVSGLILGWFSVFVSRRLLFFLFRHRRQTLL